MRLLIEKQKYFPLAVLLVILSLFLFVRLYHFSSQLDFATDQASSSLQALQIWQTKEIVLIGPTFSININGRYAFQGSAIYYFQLLFLLLGQWQPVVSSGIFVLFAGLMIFPLFQGTKWLINQKAAYVMVCVYSFFPMYVQYSRFLWNPNYQLTLFPLAIWLMGKFQRTQQKKWFLLVAVMLGFLLQFHYQFLIVIVGLTIYYFLFKRLSLQYLWIFVAGGALGFSPLLLFEVRHQFYNTQTIFFFLQTIIHERSLASTGTSFQAHDILTVSLAMVLTVLAFFGNKVPRLFVPIFGVILAVWAIIIAFTPSNHAFGMPANWNFPKEQTAADLIERQHLTNFRVINLIYETKATVQTYLLTKDGFQQPYQDYSNEEYLFVLGTTDDLAKTQAYEFTTFTPKKLLQTWKLDDSGHQLWLFQRSSK